MGMDASTRKDDRTPVLITAHTNTFFIEMYRVAQVLKNSSQYRPIVLFGWSYPTVPLDIARCLREGLACFDEQCKPITSVPEPVDSGASAVPPRPGLLRRLFLAVKARCLSFFRFFDRVILGRFTLFYRYHRARQQFARTALQETGCNLLVMAGDMVGYDTADFIKVAHQRDIPVVLVPSTMSNGMEQAEIYYHNPDFQMKSFSNRLAGFLFPRWVRQHREQKMIRRPAGDVYAMELLGIAPPLPWIFNSGFADAVAVESEAMNQYYLAGGLPAAKLVATGSLANDQLAQYREQAPVVRPRLLRELGLFPERPVLLVALPPDFLYVDGGRPECDFQSYKDLVAFWMSTLQEIEGWNILLSLHPSVDPATMRYLETDRIKIGPANTASLIALCDVFVACVSSTIRWAIACGTPVVNYDVYRYRYDDYLKVPGVLILEEQHEFRATLRRLTSEAGYLQQIRLKQQACAAYWGVLDGKAGQRLLALFNSLLPPQSRLPLKEAA